MIDKSSQSLGNSIDLRLLQSKKHSSPISFKCAGICKLSIAVEENDLFSNEIIFVSFKNSTYFNFWQTLNAFSFIIVTDDARMITAGVRFKYVV